MYVYAVSTKRNSSRTGACRPQCSSAISSDRESDVRSEMARKANRIARKADSALGLEKSRGVGWVCVLDLKIGEKKKRDGLGGVLVALIRLVRARRLGSISSRGS
jgi:hypothetical protein